MKEWSAVEQKYFLHIMALAHTGFLASKDATEVMFVTEHLIVCTDLTDVTLVSEDTYGDEEEDEENEEDECEQI